MGKEWRPNWLAGSWTSHVAKLHDFVEQALEFASLGLFDDVCEPVDGIDFRIQNCPAAKVSARFKGSLGVLCQPVEKILGLKSLHGVLLKHCN